MGLLHKIIAVALLGLPMAESAVGQTDARQGHELNSGTSVIFTSEILHGECWLIDGDKKTAILCPVPIVPISGSGTISGNAPSASQLNGECNICKDGVCTSMVCLDNLDKFHDIGPPAGEILEFNPVDVPAVRMIEDQSDQWWDVLNTEPAEVQTKGLQRHWTCTDKSRILLTAEDGTKWCHAPETTR